MSVKKKLFDLIKRLFGKKGFKPKNYTPGTGVEFTFPSANLSPNSIMEDGSDIKVGLSVRFMREEEIFNKFIMPKVKSEIEEIERDMNARN